MALTSFFTMADLNPYFNGTRRCRYYDDCNKQERDFATHADGLYPQELIECRRPNEDLTVKEYRQKIWVPKTKPTFTRIQSSVGKIRRSSDWSIKYPSADDFPRIAEEETLQKYCEENFPHFTSLTNWVFDVLLKRYLTDPNAIILVMPLNPKAAATEYLRPYPLIFASCHVIEFVPGEKVILERPEGCWYYSGKDRKAQIQGRSYYVITPTRIEQWDEIDSKKNFNVVEVFEHGFNFLPCFKIGATIAKTDGQHFLYESRISGILPELNEAVREYSDLQAAKVLHVFPEPWEFSQTECTDCKGMGRRMIPGSDNQSTCTKCEGRGYVAAGPYSKLVIRPGNTMEGGAAIPNPPKGYVQKDTEIIKIMEESVRNHIYDALSAINFQFLDQTPLNQSGTAKEVDKEELNNTVYGIAEDLVRIMDNIYLTIAWYRYGTLYPDPNDLKAMTPAVTVPEQYDLLSAEFMQKEVADAKKDNLNPVITSALETEYAGKRFDSEPEVRDRVSLVLRLDPLANVSDDEKMTRLSNKGITQQAYIISSNIQEFVQRAIDENAEFPNLTLTEQKAKMKQYADEQVAAQQALIVPMDDSSEADEDIIGKIPLAVQQLSLAASRATDAGDTDLAASIKAKINQLLGQVVDATEEAIV